MFFSSVPVRMVFSVFVEPQAARAGFGQAGPEVRRSRQVRKRFLQSGGAEDRCVNGSRRAGKAAGMFP